MTKNIISIRGNSIIKTQYSLFSKISDGAWITVVKYYADCIAFNLVMLHTVSLEASLLTNRSEHPCFVIMNSWQLRFKLQMSFWHWVSRILSIIFGQTFGFVATILPVGFVVSIIMASSFYVYSKQELIKNKDKLNTWASFTQNRSFKFYTKPI